MQELISLDEARAKGLAHYFTGRPCRNGHIDRRRTKGNNCLTCQTEAVRKYVAKNPSGHNERTKQWRKDNPEKWKAAKRKSTLLGRYGLSVEEYEAMLLKQGNVCLICNETFTSTPHVDHCHKSNRIRGLLCSNCNTALGLLNDDPERLLRAAAYLRSTGS